MRTWVNDVEQSAGPDLTTDPATNRFAFSTTATYDAFGNQTSWVGGVRTAGWDSMPMMATHSDGVNGWDYFYTADDERIGVRRASTGQYEWFLRDLGGKVLRQYTDAAWVKDYVYRDGSLLAAVDASGTRHFHLDHLGTPRLITGANRIVTGHTYWPFGEETTSVTADAERMKFTGHERDLNGGALTGNNNYLDYMHARYYSPVMGRFLSVDPVLDIEKAVKEPQRWNRYAYVENNPINKFDPDGRESAQIRINAEVNSYVTHGIQPSWHDPTLQKVALVTMMVLSPVDEGVLAGRALGWVGRGAARLFGKADEVITAGKGLGNPFKGKTSEQIDQMFKSKGFETRGPDPVGGKGGYVNPQTGRSYHIDPGGKYKKGVEKPHVDVNRPKDSPLPKRKYPLDKDGKLHEPY